MEYGWLLNHEDLLHQNIELMSGRNINQHVGHGTSVLELYPLRTMKSGILGLRQKRKQRLSQIRDNGQYNTLMQY